MSTTNIDNEPLTVGTLTLLLKGVLEKTFDDVWVVGETSGVSHARSGHCYLTLKDETALLPSALWKSSMMRVKFDIHDGLMVLCHGRIDVYPPHGKYQLIVDRIEPLGQGGLELAFRQLYDKLEKEGLFAPGRKRPIPTGMKRVAVVTSPTGAAIRDFLQILRRRTRRMNVLIVPVRVQGDGASLEIARAIQTLNMSPENSIDCIIVTRGGGSLEDLWAFNEEPLVRAVANSKIPVVSAVGHEIDVTLCDLAADFRALTPSEAAERIASDDSGKEELLQKHQRSLQQLLTQKIEFFRQKIDRFAKHPLFLYPRESLVFVHQNHLNGYEEKLHYGIEKQLESARKTIGQLTVSLEALSPLAVLSRGYSLTFDTEQKLITSEKDVCSGQEIQTKLANGTISSIVKMP